MPRRLSPGQKAPGRIAYVDGRYVPHGSATVHIEDRGLQFADSVYEVYAVSEGRILDEAGHVTRLERSLSELEMDLPMAKSSLAIVLREIIRRNRLRNGLVYLQVTRGVFHRDHVIPGAVRPTVILTASRLDPETFDRRRRDGTSVVTAPDTRWGRCDIKTTGLLPNILAKTAARRAGALEAWLVDGDGNITEGTSTNAWIVSQSGVAVTRSLEANILGGVTRATLLRAAAESQIRIEERTFSVKEAQAAAEAFITSATGGIIPVVRVDGHVLGDGKAGTITMRLHEIYKTLAEKEAAQGA